MRRARQKILTMLAAAQAREPLGTPKDSGLEITDITAYPLREPASGRSYCVIRLRTRGGVVGYGECQSVERRELALARQALDGMPASAYEVVAERLERVGATKISGAVNMALLDIAGKAVRVPVYQLLGGPTRFKARALVALTGNTDGELIESARKCWDEGFRAFVVPVPSTPYRNQGQAWVLAVRQRLEGLRKALGEDSDFVLDGSGRLTPGDAASAAAALEKFHLLWFDEPCCDLSLSALRRISHETVTPVGLGRNVQQASVIQNLLREEVVDVIRPSISRCGITLIRRMAAIAETHYVAVAPYHDGGPVATAAALQLAASLPNFYIQQSPVPVAEKDRQMRVEVAGPGLETVRDGFWSLPTGAGLGITVSEKALEKYRGGEA